MRRILCPTDFSETAQNAITYAARFAQATGAELILLNVQSLFERSPQEVVFGDSHTVERAMFLLEEQSQEIAKTFSVPCSVDVQPATEMLSSIIQERAKNTDLIVMGTNGADDLYQFFFGSNTYHVIRKTSIPLLLIPEECSYSKIERTVLAFDYLHERTLPVSQLMPWMKILRSKLSVLQVMKEADDDAQAEMEMFQLLFSNGNKDKIQLNFDAIRSSEVARSIHSYILRNEADLLALCTHNYNFIEKIFHESVIKTVTGIASYPVWVYHK